MSQNMVLTQTYHLSQGDFNRNLMIKPYAVFNMFQEAAAQHATGLHLGYETMRSENIAWILLRNRYTVLKQPTEFQDITIETWPLPSDRLDYDREYRFIDKEGNILIKGTSKWSVIDLETKRLTLRKVRFEGEFRTERILTAISKKLFRFRIRKQNFPTSIRCGKRRSTAISI